MGQRNNSHGSVFPMDCILIQYIYLTMVVNAENERDRPVSSSRLALKGCRMDIQIGPEKLEALIRMLEDELAGELPSPATRLQAEALADRILKILSA
jgi:hypothetical protein